MKKAFSHLILFFFFCAQLSACSTHRARINYQDFNDRGVALKSGDWPGEDLGPIEGEDGGYVWSQCSEKAKGSMGELIDQAKMKGANAIGGIRWDASRSSEPRCKKGWGYVLLFPFLFTPLFMSTRVHGRAYKVRRLSEHMTPLPRTEEEKQALIELWIAQSHLQ